MPHICRVTKRVWGRVRELSNSGQLGMVPVSWSTPLEESHCASVSQLGASFLRLAAFLYARRLHGKVVVSDASCLYCN